MGIGEFKEPLRESEALPNKASRKEGVSPETLRELNDARIEAAKKMGLDPYAPPMSPAEIEKQKSLTAQRSYKEYLKGEESLDKMNELKSYVGILEKGHYVPSAVLKDVLKEAKEWEGEEWNDLKSIRSGNVTNRNIEAMKSSYAEKSPAFSKFIGYLASHEGHGY